MRLEFDSDDRLALVVSRTNLLTLLAKLDGYPPDSGLTIEGGIEAAGIRLRAEEDSVHYANRDRGLMHPDTELAIRPDRGLEADENTGN